MRIAIAGLAYFAIVFGAGFVFGVFRETVLTPAYGRTAAIMLEAPFMLLAIAAGAWIVVHRRSSTWSKIALLTIGLIGFLLVQIADFGVGLGLRGLNVQDQIAYLQTTAGRLYLGLLGVFALMPLAMGALATIEHRSGHRPAPLEER